MGVGHHSLLLSSAFLGGQFVCYNSFFVLQVVAVSFFLCLSSMLQSPSCTCRGQPKLPLVLVKVVPDYQASSSYTGRDLACQYFSRCLLSVIFPIITRSQDTKVSESLITFRKSYCDNDSCILCHFNILIFGLGC